MPLTITPLYAGIVALAFAAMTILVVRARYRYRVSVGTGDDPALLRIVRGHGNFAEYVPLTLVLMALAEITGAPAVAVHAVGAALLAGRAMHAWCFMLSDGNLRVRVCGMLLTQFALISGGLLCLRAAIVA